MKRTQKILQRGLHCYTPAILRVGQPGSRLAKLRIIFGNYRKFSEVFGRLGVIFVRLRASAEEFCVHGEPNSENTSTWLCIVTLQLFCELASLGAGSHVGGLRKSFGGGAVICELPEPARRVLANRGFAAKPQTCEPDRTLRVDYASYSPEFQKWVAISAVHLS